MPRARALLVALTTLAAPTSLLAQGSLRDPVAAEALFREGRDLVKHGDYASACPKFLESWKLDRTPGALLNLADCDEHVGKVATAWLHYTQLLQQLPQGDERAVVAREHVSALEPKLPRLSIALAKGTPAGTSVKRDGLELGEGSMGDPLPIDPGHHAIVVSAPHYADRTYEIDLKEGDARDVVVSPGAARETVPSTPSSSTNAPVGGWLLTGVGVVGLAVGGVTGGLVIDKKNTFQAHCDAQKVCDPAGLDAASSGKTLSTISTVSVIVGAAALAAGIYIVVSAPSSDGGGGSSALGASPLLGGAAATFRTTF